MRTLAIRKSLGVLAESLFFFAFFTTLRATSAQDEDDPEQRYTVVCVPDTGMGCTCELADSGSLLYRCSGARLPLALAENTTDIQLVNMQQSQIVRKSFSYNTAIVTLEISDSLVSSISSTAFGNYPSLVKLKLHSNVHLVSLPADVFTGLKKLQVLTLDYNHLRVLPQCIFQGLTQLTSINVKGNRLTSLPNGLFSDLPHLQAVSLSGNNMSVIQPQVFSTLPNKTSVTMNEADPLSCSCSALWLLQLFHAAIKASVSLAFCASPSSLSGAFFESVRPRDICSLDKPAVTPSSQEVTRGRNAIFACESKTETSTPIYRWFVNGQQVDTKTANSRYTTFGNLLHIRNVMANDSGDITCLMLDAGLTTNFIKSSSSKLVVTEKAWCGMSATSEEDNSGSSGGLGNGAIIGISFGCVIALAIIMGCICMFSEEKGGQPAVQIFAYRSKKRDHPFASASSARRALADSMETNEPDPLAETSAYNDFMRTQSGPGRRSLPDASKRAATSGFTPAASDGLGRFPVRSFSGTVDIKLAMLGELGGEGNSPFERTTTNPLAQMKMEENEEDGQQEKGRESGGGEGGSAFTRLTTGPLPQMKMEESNGVHGGDNSERDGPSN